MPVSYNFSIEPRGGAAYLSSLLALSLGAGLTCLPTGCRGKEKVSQYPEISEVSWVGGNWITPQSRVSGKNAKGMTKLAKSSLLLANAI